jgi:ankyrin
MAKFNYFAGDMSLVNLLLDREVNTGATDCEGDTALHKAAQCGHVNAVEAILLKNIEIIDQKNKLGQTALHQAATDGYSDVCKLLLENKANSEILDCFCKPPLFYAVNHDQMDVVKCLAEHGAELNSNGKNRHSPLYWAARKGDLKLCTYLIEKGANMNKKIEKFQQTPLHEATWKGHLHIVKYLVEKRADIGIKDYEGSNALHMACRRGHFGIVKFLLEQKGSKLNSPDKRGNTALHLAVIGCGLENGIYKDEKKKNDFEINLFKKKRICLMDKRTTVKADTKEAHSNCHQRYLDIAKELIEKRAEVNMKNKNGASPLHLAVMEGHLDLTKVLLDAGARVKDKEKNNAIHLATSTGQSEILKLVINKNKSKLNDQNADKNTPLHLALNLGNIDIIRILIDNGANINIKDNEGNTAVQLAIKNGLEEIIILFLQSDICKIDNKNKDDKGNTVLHLAIKENKDNIAKLLIEDGANVRDTDFDGNNSLHLASKIGSLELVLYIVGTSKLNTMNKAGLTPLHTAVLAGHLQVKGNP